MKKIKILYWVFNGLFGAFMLFSAIPDVLQVPDAIKFIVQLGYPAYLVPFIGIAKVLGVAAILIPGYPRIKEWAYAGLMFDLIGAMYSVIAIGTPFSQWFFFLIFIGFAAAAYIFYHKKIKVVS